MKTFEITTSVIYRHETNEFGDITNTRKDKLPAKWKARAYQMAERFVDNHKMFNCDIYITNCSLWKDNGRYTQISLRLLVNGIFYSVCEVI